MRSSYRCQLHRLAYGPYLLLEVLIGNRDLVALARFDELLEDLPAEQREKESVAVSTDLEGHMDPVDVVDIVFDSMKDTDSKW